MSKQRNLFASVKSKKGNNKKLLKKLEEKKTVTKTVRGRTQIQQKVNLIKQNEKELTKGKENYLLIERPEQLYDYIDKIVENGIYSYDTEATGLDKMEDEVVGFSLYTPGEKACYVPLRHTDLFDNRVEGQLEIEEAVTTLKKISDIDCVFHTADYDLRISYYSLSGELLEPGWDVRIAAKLLNENDSAKLKYLYNTYINEEEDAGSYNQLFEGLPFNYVPIEIGYVYGAKDAKITFELYKFQKEHLYGEKAEKADLVEAGKLMEEIEVPLIKVIVEMENYGIKVDDEYADKLKREYRGKLEKVENKINKYISELAFSNLSNTKKQKLDDPVNMGSPTQVAIILYDVMGLNKVSGRGTGEPVLEKLREKATGKQEQILDYILEYRGISKLLSTYIEAIPEKVSDKTGRLHFNINQYGAKTGRTSSSDPNMQNIPSKNKEIRKMFVPSEGYGLICADYSQQEPRILAHITQDENMLKAYDQGKDIYAWMGSIVFGVPYEDCLEFKPDGTVYPEGKKRRKSMKVLVLALMYGSGVTSIAESLDISVNEAKKIVDKLFNEFPRIKETQDRLIQQTRECGYVKTVWGRKRRLPEINLPEFVVTGTQDAQVREYYANKLSRLDYYGKKDLIKELRQQGLKVKDNGGRIAHAERQCINSIIQGTAADISKKAMIDVFYDEKLNKLDYHEIILVHDEIIGEAPMSNLLEAAERVSKVMSDAPKDKIQVPFKVDFDIVDRWYGGDLTDEF